MTKLILKIVVLAILLIPIEIAKSNSLTNISFQFVQDEGLDVSVKIATQKLLEVEGQRLVKSVLGNYIKNHHKFSNALHIAKSELAIVKDNAALEQLWALRVANASDALSDLESSGKFLFNKLGVQTGLVDNIAKAPVILDGLDIILDGKRFLDATENGDFEKANQLAHQTYVKGGVAVGFILGGAGSIVTAPASVGLGLALYINGKTEILHQKHSEWATKRRSAYNIQLNNTKLELHLKESTSEIYFKSINSKSFNEKEVEKDIRTGVISVLENYLSYIDAELDWFNENRKTRGLYNTGEDIELTDFLKNQRDIIHGLKIATSGNCSFVGNCDVYKNYINGLVSISLNEIKKGIKDKADTTRYFDALKAHVQKQEEKILSSNRTTEVSKYEDKDNSYESERSSQSDLSNENLSAIAEAQQPEVSVVTPEVTPTLETDEPTDDGSTFDRLTTNVASVGVLNSNSRGGSGVLIGLQPDLGGGSVRITETFNVDDFAYTTLGRWSAVAGTPSAYSQGGFFATIDGTPTTAIQSLSGSASYNGNIIGEFVSNSGSRDDARGRIELGVNFSDQSVTGQFQLGHNCSSASGGPSSCSTLSRVANFSEPINDFLTSNGAGFGNISEEARTSGSGIVGIFGGPNGEEIAGDVFLADNGGIYNGVFQAGRGNIEPDVIIPTNQESEQLTGYVTGGDFNLTNNGQSFVVGTQDSQINGSINDESVTLNFEDGNGNSQTVLTTNRTESDYNYLTWGLTNQLLSRASRSEQFTHTLENSFWLVGQQTPENILAERMGTATFLGDINGHLIDASDGTDLDDLEETAGNYYNAVTGNVMFSADFSSNSITGAGTFLINTPFDDNVQEDFRIIGDLSDTIDGPSRTVLPSNSNANFSASSSVNTVSRLSGNSGEGYLLGSFFGSQAQEFGGAFGYFANDGGGAITGVVTAREGGGPIEEQNGDGPILGFIAAKAEGRQFLITDNLYTGLEDGGDAEVGRRGEARLVRDSVNTLYSDGVNSDIQVTLNSTTRGSYSYTDWGEWNGQGRTLAQLAGASVDGNGLFVIGTSTRADQLPRTGTASYSGEAEAIGFSGERLNGDVEFNANFGNNTIEGDINLNRANGDAWISANTGNLNIQSRTSVVEYNGQSSNVRGANGEQFSGATLFIGGRFYGPNAEEIAGDFAVSGVPDEVGGVDGVYRAQQSVSTGRPSDGGPGIDLPRDIIETTSRTNF